ncbi:hypothetical protein [Comamonas endophytica]|uniref:DUF4124 domain-containing protein n=1 Tax=Comamonas endophytica TaxID=2949090 RepID=A0ABY6G7X2_9BURK|nr:MULTISPECIES: hypothetical protein [unclassified Acidovorax]MCD2514574.1 hypothetical protein [Acidovorax sp. D4N7]UYG51151.1 hypothetical protein M9799_13795 [Acidovorax sp. 5MLIR]
MLRIACGALFFVLAGVAQAQVYRCGSSYSHAPCKGGQVIDTAPVMSDPRGPVTKEIYLCSAAAGSSYWSSAHCAERGWRIERIERVPANMSWEEQVAAARQARESASQALAAPVQRAPQVSAPASPPAKVQCRTLDERVEMLYSMGRAGSRYYDLNWVRHERKKARDQQYRLRC